MMLHQSQANLKNLLLSLLLSCYATTSIFALASRVGPQRTVLVTGGAGYIGSHTCLELLNIPGDQYKVVVVDNLDNSSEESLKRVRELAGCDPGRIQFRNCDIRDKVGLKKGKKIFVCVACYAMNINCFFNATIQHFLTYLASHYSLEGISRNRLLYSFCWLEGCR